jgi:3D (Asp-Asp-Asp) domain-containing protein
MRIVREHSLKAVLLLALVAAAAMLPWYPEAAEAEAVVNPAAAYTASTQTLQKQQTAPVVGTKPVAAPVQKTVTPVQTPAQAAAAAKTQVKATAPVTQAGQVAAAKAQAKVVPAGFMQVTIQKYGVSRVYATAQKTVGGLLQDLGISYQPRSVYPGPATLLKSGMVVHIVGRYETFETVMEPVAFATKYQDDKALAYGKTEVITAGVAGEDKVIYQNVLRNGIFQRQEIERVRTKEPQTALIKRGAAQSINTGAGPIGYKRKITVEASAYTLGEGSGTGMTSIGIIPYEGIVAVDPNFIPYYTKMYIPGYGFAMAGDTGGAIRGYKIDLFMTSYYRAIQWGRRTIDIYIL